MSPELAAFVEALAEVERGDDPNASLARGLSLIMERAACPIGIGLWFQHEELDLIVTKGLEERALPADVRETCACICQGIGATTILAQTDGAEPYRHKLCEALGVKKLLVVPLGEAGAPKGCIICGIETSQGLDGAIEDALRLAGPVLGMAIECVASRMRVRQQMRLTQTLYDVSQAAIATADVDELLHFVVKAAVSTIENAENCVLHLFDESSGELKPRALSYLGQPPQEESRSHMRLGEGAAGHALLLRQAVNVPDVSRDPRFVRVSEGRHFASMLTAPLTLGERRIGTLSVDSSRTQAFCRDDERLLMMLASHAASAIENSRLLHDLQDTIHQLRSMQEQLIEVEKLSAMGRMISGVTHELNNPLSAVMGYAQLLQINEALDAASRHDVDRIYAQAERAARIVRNLQLFARQEAVTRQRVNINEIIESVIDLLGTQLRLEHIQVQLQLHRYPLPVMGDYNHLQQVFFHLVSNARDAISQWRGYGRLDIETGCDGKLVQVRIADNGPGFSAEVKRHLFDPFFTTKEVGLGTGLGLSVCYGIVTGHGGRIYADSQDGEGAVFVVELPAASC